MQTYQLNGKIYLVHENKLFVEAESVAGGGPTQDERTTAALGEAVETFHRGRKVKGEAKVRKIGKGARKCGNCGEPGHTARTCPKANGRVEEEKPEEPRGLLDEPVRVSGEAMSDDLLREKIAEYRAEGKPSLWIAAKLRIRLTKVQEFWQPNPQEQQHDNEETPETAATGT